MFYQEALPIFHVDSLLTIGDTGEKLAAMLKIQIHFCLQLVMVPFHVGYLFLYGCL